MNAHSSASKLQDCHLDTLSVAALPLLFPVMREDHGRIQLDGQWSVDSEVSFSILAAQTRVHEMDIRYHVPKPEMLHELGQFSSLKSLALSGVRDVSSLSLDQLCVSAGNPSAGPGLQLTTLKLV